MRWQVGDTLGPWELRETPGYGVGVGPMAQQLITNPLSHLRGNSTGGTNPRLTWPLFMSLQVQVPDPWHLV